MSNPLQKKTPARTPSRPMAGRNPRRKWLFSLSHFLNFCKLSYMIFRLKQPQQRYDDADLYTHFHK
jgi:hypothetical protein